MTDSFTDEQLGLITVRINARARRIIMRPQISGIVVTIPPHTSQRTLTNTLENFRQRLRAHQLELQKNQVEDNTKETYIDLKFRIETDLLTLTLEQGNSPKFLLRAEPGQTTIVCPPNICFNETERQEWLHRVIERALRQQAQWLLPERLRTLSILHNLPFNSCKVNVSKGRWGSCSIRKDINLSCYLILLPTHLREYVMLHELCHTREMNHGPLFWEMLNSLTEGRAKSLRKELKEYHTHF